MAINKFGKALRYISEAIVYGTEPLKAAKRRTNPIIRAMFTTSSIAPSTSTDEDRYMRMGATNASVYHAIDIIAKRVANAKNFITQIRQGGEWIDAPNHQFVSLLQSPNSMMTGTLLLSETVWWFNLAGNAYLFIDTPSPGKGPILGLYTLQANACAPLPNTIRISDITGVPTVDYTYTINGQMKTIPGENIIHIRTANPFDFWVGLSPLSALQTSLDTSYAQANWLASYFEEGNAIPTAIISVPEETSDPDFDEIRQAIIEDFGAKRRAAITRGGELSVETIQHTIDEMRVLDGLNYQDAQVMKVYNIPPGLTSASSGQARLAAETALARDVVQPQIDFISEVLTASLRVYYGENFQIIGENVVPQDRAMEITEYQTYGAENTINENRKDRGREELKFGGDLAVLQPLLSDIPIRLLDMIGPAILQKMGGGQPNQIAGQEQSITPIVSEMAGILNEKDAILAELTAHQQQTTQANTQQPNTTNEIGPMTNGGLQTQEQMMDSLTGDGYEEAMPPTAIKGVPHEYIDELSPEEIDAMQYAIAVLGGSNFTRDLL